MFIYLVLIGLKNCTYFDFSSRYSIAIVRKLVENTEM